MTRLKAFLIHLGLSLIIFLSLLYVIVYYWYPAPFFSTDGGWQGLRIIATVDIVLGPVLTLVIFNPKKPQNKIRFDLTVIGIIQFGALVSGTWIVYKEHPVAKVICDGIISPITANDLRENNLDKAALDRYRIDDTVTIYCDWPDDFEAMQKIRVRAFKAGKPAYLFPEYYRPVTPQRIKKLELFSINMDKYLANNEKGRKRYDTFLQKHNIAPDEVLFLPLHSRYARTIAVLDKKTIRFVGVIGGLNSPDVADMEKLIRFKREIKIKNRNQAKQKPDQDN